MFSQGLKYPELIKTDWYEEKDIPYIITMTDPPGTFIDDDSMTSMPGEPDRIYKVGAYELWYWNNDISGYVSVN